MVLENGNLNSFLDPIAKVWGVTADTYFARYRKNKITFRSKANRKKPKKFTEVTCSVKYAKTGRKVVN